MVRFFFFMIGFGLTLIGSLYIILYLNLTTMGYNFLEYANFIIRRFECWNLVLGLIIIFLSLSKGDKNELPIRYFIKL